LGVFIAKKINCWLNWGSRWPNLGSFQIPAFVTVANVFDILAFLSFGCPKGAQNTRIYQKGAQKAPKCRQRDSFLAKLGVALAKFGVIFTIPFVGIGARHLFQQKVIGETILLLAQFPGNRLNVKNNGNQWKLI
jgi:hypothetical protein